jgi:hypothetical protein
MGNDDFKITMGDSTYDTSTLDTITIDTSFTNDTGSEYTFNSNADYCTPITVGGVLNDDVTYTIGGFNEDYLDTTQVENMCEEYPALKTAYEKFKTIYDMTLQDWKGKQDD